MLFYIDDYWDYINEELDLREDSNDDVKPVSVNIEANKGGAFCRACNEYNKYGEPDRIINDGKFTCWKCVSHPERKRRGLPSEEKVKELERFYRENYKTWNY